MNTGIPKPLYHGTRANLKSGDLITPGNLPDVAQRDFIFLTPQLDAAIWDAEISAGEGPSKVYVSDWYWLPYLPGRAS